MSKDFAFKGGGETWEEYHVKAKPRGSAEDYDTHLITGDKVEANNMARNLRRQGHTTKIHTFKQDH